MCKFYMFFCLSLGLLNFSEAKGIDFSASFKCASKIESIVKEWKATDRWRTEPRLNGDLKYFTNSKDFGVWIQVFKESPKIIILEKIDSESVLRLKISDEKCRPDIEVIKKEKDKTYSQLLTDEDLNAEIKQKNDGIIISWSPSMPFSIQGVQQAIEFAQKSKVRLIVVLDRGSNEITAKNILNQNKWPLEYGKKFNSIELNYRKLENHFPSALFFRNGEIVDYLVPGLKTAAAYKAEFEGLK